MRKRNTTNSQRTFIIASVSGFASVFIFDYIALRSQDSSRDVQKERIIRQHPSMASIIVFILLALQCGVQPLLVKYFMPETVVRSTCVMAQEGIKFAVSVTFLLLSGKWEEAISGWTLNSAIMAAGFPAALFSTQTYLNIMANQILSPVSFAVLNQTKILSTAVFCYIILRQPQSSMQVIALCILVVAALVLQKRIPIPCDEETKSKTMDEENPLVDKNVTGVNSDHQQVSKGVIPALTASCLSGLAGALTQLTLKHNYRSPTLFNMELAVFSSLFMILTLLGGSPDYQKLKNGGVTQGWTWKTWIPICSSSAGAILIGLITKYEGAVVKGFAIVFGMIISGILQQLLLAKDGNGVTWNQFLGGCLGALSLCLHASFPPIISE